MLLSIQVLLAAPEPDDPLDSSVAELFKSDYAEFERKGAFQKRRGYNRIHLYPYGSSGDYNEFDLGSSKLV